MVIEETGEVEMRQHTKEKTVPQKRAFKYILFAALYITQALPLAFFTVAVPFILRRGVMDLSNI